MPWPMRQPPTTPIDSLPDGVLHPCQQAMVDCHGSQCGFCTPGFVMSLYANYCAPVDAPVVPTLPISSPRWTVWPARTRIADWWP